MKKVVWSLMLAAVCSAKPQDSPGIRRTNRPAPTSERAYHDYDDYGQSNHRNIDTHDEDDEHLYDAGVRSPSDRSGGVAPAPPGQFRQGPPLQGLLSFDDDRTDCKPKYRTLPHDKYCDVYYELAGCDGRSDSKDAILRSCPNGLVYTGNGRNGLIGVCDYPHRADCNGKERHNPPSNTEHCDWLYGIFGHETSCTRYWTCWNGTATEQFCIGGLLYNEETHSCDWPQNVGGCQKHPLCKDDANGNVPLGKSCNRYWACQGGYPRLQRCPAMLVFDKNAKRCVAPPTEDCDVPVPLPEDEEQQQQQQQEGPNSGEEDNLPPLPPPPPLPPRQGGPGKTRFPNNQPGPPLGPFRPDNSRPLPQSFQLPEDTEPLN